MNKYVVGYLSQFDNYLLLEIVEAESELDACISYLQWEDDEMPKSMDELHDMCANSDSSINVIQIDRQKKHQLEPIHNPVRDIYIQ